MKIVFVSGFLNNHLLPLCEALNERADFNFIATEQREGVNRENRDALERPYVLHDYIADEENQCQQVITAADIAILGGSSDKYLTIRKAVNKPAFIYSERVFKKGRIRRFYPPTRNKLRNAYIANNEKLFVLCASSYLAGDIALLGFDTLRCFKFGYLPKIKRHSLDEVLASKSLSNSEPLKLLYVGRLLKLKKIDNLLKMCSLLDNKGVKYTLDIIGEGPERAKLEKMKKKLRLENVVFQGPKPIDLVYEQMLKSNILYLPSNYYEGWGAVVNEALGCGCAVIATASCGSARYIIDEGKNGYIAVPNSPNSLLECTLHYISSPNKKELHRNAYDTVWQKWNADIASERLITVSEAIINNQPVPGYQDGPLSLD